MTTLAKFRKRADELSIEARIVSKEVKAIISEAKAICRKTKRRIDRAHKELTAALN